MGAPPVIWGFEKVEIYLAFLYIWIDLFNPEG
jgi:hypothetical protein